MATLSKSIQDIIDRADDCLYREEIYINDSHEYDYHKHEISESMRVHTLYYSDNDEWSDHIRKNVAMQILDNGDGLQIIGISTKKQLTYLEAEQLHILLRLSSSHSVYQIAPPPAKKDF